VNSQQPVLIGGAQLSDRDATLETAMSPLDMLSRIVREAAASSGGDPNLVTKVDTIALASIFAWRAKNPPALLAEVIGAKPSKLIASHVGGETALALTNLVASRITSGECQLGFVGGCNNLRTLSLAQKAGASLDWPVGGEQLPDIVGTSTSAINEAEKAVGLSMPIQVYPIFENALRAARGQTLTEHRETMGRLFAGLSSVAAANPYAWFPTERSADELTQPGDTNRMICFPYPKYLNAVMITDQAAGALLASQEMARKLGVPEENWIYWRGGAYEVEEPWFFSERESFSDSPAMRRCHEGALASAGLALDEVDLFDFYSCFPSAVSMACEMLGMSQDDPRGFTLTGGLPYAGGPGNSYCFHSLAAAVDRLREKSGEHALVTGNGWYLTKHSATLLSRQPRTLDSEFATRTIEDTSPRNGEPSAVPVVVRSQADGASTVETYTVVHGRDGMPNQGIIIGRLLDSGERFLANTPTDPGLLADLESNETVGAPGTVRHEAGHNIFRPA
jgi:acetyl-CoA C-acetyltransferase